MDNKRQINPKIHGLTTADRFHRVKLKTLSLQTRQLYCCVLVLTMGCETYIQMVKMMILVNMTQELRERARKTKKQFRHR